MGMIHPPDPSAYEVRVPPVTLTHVGIMPWAPLGLPINAASWLHGGHDTLPLHGDPWSAMNDQ